MLSVREYVDELGRSRFANWLNTLDDVTRARVTIGINRFEAGNSSAVKSVGAGVSELRMNFSAGYRVYFGRDGHTLVLLLGGGDKSTQVRDIALAHAAWRAYKQRKAKGESPWR